MTAMIDITNAEKTFTMHLQGGVELPVVRGVSFHVEPGECVVLSGPSGAGKSSILKMIFGNYRCDGGRIGIRHQGSGDRSCHRRAAAGAQRAPRDHRLCQPVPARGAAGRHHRCGGRAPDRERNGTRGGARAGRARCCAVSTFPSGCGRCRHRPSPAANSSASTSRAASFPICRSCCWTSRPPRSMRPIARSSSS